MPDSHPRVVIIDYEMSNLFSVLHACEHVGIQAEVSSQAADVAEADALILPGVGAFKDAMDNLRRLDLLSPIKDSIAAGKPFLGVCLGLQLLFDGSEEFGGSDGLGIIPGRVVRFPETAPDGSPMRVPHIGWNRITPPQGCNGLWTRGPLASAKPGDFMYFIHSFHAVPENSEDVLARTEYCGMPFCSAARRENIFATQFHPEKSGGAGLAIYKNWTTAITGQGE